MYLDPLGFDASLLFRTSVAGLGSGIAGYRLGETYGIIVVVEGQQATWDLLTTTVFLWFPSSPDALLQVTRNPASLAYGSFRAVLPSELV